MQRNWLSMALAGALEHHWANLTGGQPKKVLQNNNKAKNNLGRCPRALRSNYMARNNLGRCSGAVLMPKTAKSLAPERSGALKSLRIAYPEALEQS